MSIRMPPATQEGLLTICVSGRFAFDDHRDFRNALNELPAAKVVMIEFGECTDLDSSAIGMLANLEEQVRSQGTEIRLVGCSDKLRQIFELVELNHLLK